MADRVLGVDVGGTFTDLVLWDGEHLRTGKVSTTDDQSDGVVTGATAIIDGPVDGFLHGTTVATNALLERKGARTALVTTEGFADAIEIARQDRPSLYDSSIDRPEPLVPRTARFEVPRASSSSAAGASPQGENTAARVPSSPAGATRTERSTIPHPSSLSGGGGAERSEVTEGVSRSNLRESLEEVEAVAVSLLYGFDQPEYEQAVAAAIRAHHPDLPISLSSEVAPEFREYERTSTTVLNAYLAPRFGTYLRHLAERGTAAGLPAQISVMRSSGGLLPIDVIADLPVAALLSGPSGGVVAAAALGEALGKNRLISFDMGGTSTDVCRIDDGRPDVAYGREVDGYACLQPSVAINTVGAGGGSIAWVDRGGSLRVGPASAGANPGPAAYGQGGTEPTVTDANVMLGRIDPSGTLAGGLQLHPDLAEQGLRKVGETAGLSLGDTALGITTVVEEVMAGALRKVSIEQGADPRGATLIAFGGAGGLHATALAKRLEMSGVAVPTHAGVFSALGLLLSPPRVDRSRSVLLHADGADRLDAMLADVLGGAVDELGSADATVEGFVDTRYIGQAHEIAVPHSPGDGWDRLATRFHEMHRSRNGFSRPDDPIEVVTVRAEAVGRAAIRWEELPAIQPVGDPVTGTRSVGTETGAVEATVYRRRGLRPGDEIVGPAVVEEDEATTYLAPGDLAVVHDSGALEIEW